MTEQSSDSFYNKAHNPYRQALIVQAVSLIVMVGANLLDASGLFDIHERFAWLTAASFLLFFALFNSIFSLAAADMNQYWSKSMVSFMALGVLSALFAWFFSSVPMGEAGSYRWIYIVVTFGYLVFLSLMRLTKNIVEFAEREEWTQPRRRK